MSQKDSIDKMNRELDEALSKSGSVSPINRKPSQPRTFIGGLGKALTGSVDAANTLIQARESGRLDIEIDPTHIRRSKFSNRLDLAYQDEEYRQLKSSIEAHGQEIPILVRPIAEPAQQDAPQQYEIAYGHRRHQACLELGIKVRALVRPMTDRQLIAAMDIENRERSDLSAYEDALQIRRWLDEAVYQSQSEIAELTGRDRTGINRLLSLLDLPPVVFEAFRDPRIIRVRWIQHLTQAAKRHGDAFIAEAEQLAKATPAPAAEDVYEALQHPRKARKEPAKGAKNKPEKPHPVYWGRPKVMTVLKKGKGLSIRFTDRVPASIQDQLAKLVEEELLERLEQEDVPK